MYGIPNMKLDKNVVQDRVDLMAAEGVVFITNCEVGKDYSAGKLKSEFDAIVLCGGATKPRDIVAENRALKGVHFAIEFLGANTRHLLSGGGDLISAEGKKVIVIGGGDTGTDCVGTSIRHGCASVRQLEIMPKPAAERLPENPWPQFPRVLKTDYGQEEAIALYGSDPRSYNITAKKFTGDEAGNVKEVHTISVEWVQDDQGRVVPREVPGSEKIWPADLVLLAMGFLGPEDQLLNQLGISRDPRSNVKTGHDSYATNVEGIYAAGDMRRGQSLVVWAISEGRQVAAEVDRYLMGSSNL
jgi:glutamate synthase (NADPH/NADH) small chain